MAIDTTKPNTSQTIKDVIDTTRNNFVEAVSSLGDKAPDADLTALEFSVTTHVANVADAHGVDAIKEDVDAQGTEILSARGTELSLDDRLSVALQDDGTVKLTSLASRWIDNGDTPTYLSPLTFSVPADRTKVYLAGVIIRASQTGGYVYGVVASSSYGSVTTITLGAQYPVLGSGLSKVEIALLSFDNSLEQSVAQNGADVADLQNQISAYMAGDIQSKAIDYEFEPADYFLKVDSTGGNKTITLPRSVKAATKVGSGSLTLATSGVYVGADGSRDYKIQIDGTGSPNTFKWSNDNGLTWEQTAVAITGSAQTLEDGVKITFSGTTGGVLNDYWTFKTVTNKKRQVLIKKLVAANDVITNPADAETIDGAGSKTLSAQYASLALIGDGPNWWLR